MIFATPLGLLALAGHSGDRRHSSVSPALPGSSGGRAVPLADRAADAGRRRQDRQAADHDEPDPGMPRGAGARAHPRWRARCHRPASASISSCCSTTRRRWRRSTRAARARATARCGACSTSSIVLATGARVTLVAERRSPVGARRPGRARRRSAAARSRPGSRRRRIIRSRSALRLARELAGRTGRLMVISDVPPGSRRANSTAALWVSLGEPLANVGITAAERTLAPDEGRGAVSLTLGNYSDCAARRRRLSVSAGDKDVLARELDVPPGVSSLTLPLPAGSAGGARRAVRRCAAARQRGDAGRAAAANRRRREPPAGRPGPAGAGQGARRRCPA